MTTPDTIPLPPVSVWDQFPLLAVIVLILFLLGLGLYVLARWIWSEYKCERDKDREFQKAQNEAREKSATENNVAWQTTVKELAQRWEQQDRERDSILRDITGGVAMILQKLDRHDERAQRIEADVDAMTRPVRK